MKAALSIQTPDWLQGFRRLKKRMIGFLIHCFINVNRLKVTYCQNEFSLLRIKYIYYGHRHDPPRVGNSVQVSRR